MSSKWFNISHVVINNKWCDMRWWCFMLLFVKQKPFFLIFSYCSVRTYSEINKFRVVQTKLTKWSCYPAATKYKCYFQHRTHAIGNNWRSTVERKKKSFTLFELNFESLFRKVFTFSASHSHFRQFFDSDCNWISVHIQ